MHVRKTLDLGQCVLKVNEDSGKFGGYASVWGGVDAVGDTLVKGAFAQTLVTHGAPKMFFNHVWDMPIGKYTDIGEDSRGLHVEGELTPGLPRADDVHAAMKHGTLDGLSIGGFLKAGDFEETKGGRLIRTWSKLMEISPVVFPADGAARIDNVKSVDFESLLPECKTEKDIERLLRDAGLGKVEATALVSRVRMILKERDAPEDIEAKAFADMAALVKRISGLE